MVRARRVSAVFVVVALLLASGPRSSMAQSEVATVAAVVGGTELRRAGGGQWQLMVVGSALFEGDGVRTRPSSGAKLVFRDDSVVDVGPATELVIQRQTFDPGKRDFHSTLSLVVGKIRAAVSEYYGTPRASYEVETPTSVAGVRGTEFIVLYDAQAEYSDIVGIVGDVRVGGRLGVVGGAVDVGPHTASRVQKGRFPTAPRRIDDALFRQYLEGLDIIGTGGRDSLGSTHPAVRGTLLAQGDNVSQLPRAKAPKPTARGPQGALIVGAPDEGLASALSGDVATNDQPLLEFRASPPGGIPSGTVHVGF